MYSPEQHRRRPAARVARSESVRPRYGVPRALAEGGTLTSYPPPARNALALIVGADEWPAEALRSVLEASGYQVARAVGLDDVRDLGAQPDIVLVGAGSGESDGIALCRQLRRDAGFAPSVPVVLISTAPTTRDARVAALRAGAWEVLALPMDAVELLARVGALVQVKREADAARAEGLLEQGTGLYGVRGIERRSREVWADASRRHHALACVVFEAAPQAEQPGGEVSRAAAAAARQHLGATLQAHGRLSDIVGRLSENEFAILAPGTDAAGALKLAQRLAQLAEQGPRPSPTGPGFAVRAGYDALDDAGASSLQAHDLLNRAHAALLAARAQRTHQQIRRYAPEGPRETS